MSAEPGPTPTATGESTAGWLATIRGRAEAVATRLLGVPRVALARDVLRHYDDTSGGLLARGLAFVAIFALVPGLLLIVSIAGLFVADPESRDRLATLLAGQFAPLAPLVRTAVDEAITAAPAFSVVGFVLLAWSASGFVRGLDGAFRQLFEEPPDANGLARTVIEVVVVAVTFVLLAAGVVVLVVPGPVADLLGALPAVRAIAVPAIAILIALAYRYLPRPRPSWRAILWPAVWIGLAVAALTALYGGLGQVLAGSAQLFGPFAAAFAGLIWLGWVAELFLIGAAWVHVRTRRERG